MTNEVMNLRFKPAVAYGKANSLYLTSSQKGLAPYIAKQATFASGFGIGYWKPIRGRGRRPA